MRILSTKLDGVVIVDPTILVDKRGYLFESFESYNQDAFATAVGTSVEFVLDLHTRSKHGVIRGIHYQLRRPHAKLVSALFGRIFDVAVDLRQSSDTLGQWVSVELSADNRRQIWIPPGFGHAFLALSPNAEAMYKLSDYHSPEYNRTVCWNDSDIAIDWPLPPGLLAPILSEKDRHGVALREAEVFS